MEDNTFAAFNTSEHQEKGSVRGGMFLAVEVSMA